MQEAGLWCNSISVHRGSLTNLDRSGWTCNDDGRGLEWECRILLVSWGTFAWHLREIFAAETSHSASRLRERNIRENTTDRTGRVKDCRDRGNEERLPKLE